MVKVAMEGSKVVILLMVILGCFMIPTHSRNVVHMCPCKPKECSFGDCYCCSARNCWVDKDDCWQACRCPKVPFAASDRSHPKGIYLEVWFHPWCLATLPPPGSCSSVRGAWPRCRLVAWLAAESPLSALLPRVRPFSWRSSIRRPASRTWRGCGPRQSGRRPGPPAASASIPPELGWIDLILATCR